VSRILSRSDRATHPWDVIDNVCVMHLAVPVGDTVVVRRVSATAPDVRAPFGTRDDSCRLDRGEQAGGNSDFPQGFGHLPNQRAVAGTHNGREVINCWHSSGAKFAQHSDELDPRLHAVSSFKLLNQRVQRAAVEARDRVRDLVQRLRPQYVAECRA
jgi:hypothetical protein